MSASLATRPTLAFFFFFLWNRLDIFRSQPAQFRLLTLPQSLVPHDNIVEFFARDEHIVQLLESFMLLVHHAQHPKTVTLDLLDKVAV